VAHNASTYLSTCALDSTGNNVYFHQSAICTDIKSKVKRLYVTILECRYKIGLLFSTYISVGRIIAAIKNSRRVLVYRYIARKYRVFQKRALQL
jgi:hypothetical protein